MTSSTSKQPRRRISGKAKNDSAEGARGAERGNNGCIEILEISMPSAVFDYDEIRKRVRTGYPFRQEAPRKTSAPAPVTSSSSTVLSCDCCVKSANDAATCPFNRNTGIVGATGGNGS